MSPHLVDSAVTLSSNGPVERLGMPMMAVGPNGQEFEVVDLPESALGGMEGGQQAMMERKGPEFLSSNPQMQILTCFGHCGTARPNTYVLSPSQPPTLSSLVFTPARGCKLRQLF